MRALIASVLPRTTVGARVVVIICNLTIALLLYKLFMELTHIKPVLIKAQVLCFIPLLGMMVQQHVLEHIHFPFTRYSQPYVNTAVVLLATTPFLWQTYCLYSFDWSQDSLSGVPELMWHINLYCFTGGLLTAMTTNHIIFWLLRRVPEGH